MHVDEIADLLLLLPGLIQQQERRSVDFVRNADAWLNSLEKVFSACRLHQAGSIATLRSVLVAAGHGLVPAGLQFRGLPSRSRVLNAAAAQALHRAAEVASTVMAENQPRLAEAERVAQQVVALSVSRGLIPTRDQGVSNTQYLRRLRRGLATRDDLERGIVHLESLVGPHDALVLLDRTLAPHLEHSSAEVDPATMLSSR